MGFFIRLISGFHLFYERVKGDKIASVTIFPINNEEYLKVKIKNLELRIFCRRKQFRRKYDKWFLTDGAKSVFQLYSEILYEDSVDKLDDIDYTQLKEACLFNADIPAILPEFIAYKYHRIIMTHVYLDIVTERLKRIKNGLPS